MAEESKGGALDKIDPKLLGFDDRELFEDPNADEKRMEARLAGGAKTESPKDKYDPDLPAFQVASWEELVSALDAEVLHETST